MAEPSDATALTASQRDALYAVAEACQAPHAPALPEARAIAFEKSERFEEENRETFYVVVNEIDEMGFITTDEHPDDARQKRIGLTVAGEEALQHLAERSDEVAIDEPQ